MEIGPFEIDDAILLPANAGLGIGIIGCGGIVNYAHLPAYRQAGLNVRACYDHDPEAARRTAADHQIPTVAPTLEALLADPEIAIVDIAVTPWAQGAMALRAIAAGKHLLCQKPLCDTYAMAATVVEAARAAGVKLAVNQQMRWSAGIRVSRQLIDHGALGVLADARIDVNIQTPWQMWPWIAASDRLEIMYHSIHYQDSVRYLLGDPARVLSHHRRFPGQTEAGETRTTTLFDYGAELAALIDVGHHNWSDEVVARFRLTGDRGIIDGTIGLLYDYPTGRVDTVRFTSRETPAVWHEAALTTRWIPDAFLGPMASLMAAIAEGSEPLTSGADNLGTLRTVFASYRSAAEGRFVAPAEITS